MKRLRIQQERISKDWTLEYVAQKIGTTNQAISLIENGKRNPSYSNLLKLEELFGLPHRQLFAAADDDNPGHSKGDT